MFVRAKIIKGQKYGYLVQNTWKKGKVKQVTKKYLGKIFVLPQRNETPQLIDPSLEKKEYIIQLIYKEFFAHGFTKHPRRDAAVLEDIEVHLRSGTIKSNNKNCVLYLNERYLYSGNLIHLLDFFQPEDPDERPGTRLAAAFSDAGIQITPEEFVILYKKIYAN